jgi:hypothetical protein
MLSMKSIGVHFKQYAMVAAGGLGLTGGPAPPGPRGRSFTLCSACSSASHRDAGAKSFVMDGKLGTAGTTAGHVYALKPEIIFTPVPGGPHTIPPEGRK